jgi:hypothetical protein
VKFSEFIFKILRPGINCRGTPQDNEIILSLSPLERVRVRGFAATSTKATTQGFSVRLLQAWRVPRWTSGL